MDNSKKKQGGTATATAGSNNTSWFWTNERHVHFLNSIEATFVRTMFENDVGRATALPLDRQMPDSMESTLDLGKERRRHSSSDVAEYSRVRTDKKNKRLPSHHHDQVVPQLENRLDYGNNGTNTSH